MSSVRKLSDKEMNRLLLDLCDQGPAVVSLYEDVRDARNRVIQFWNRLGSHVMVSVEANGDETVLMAEYRS